jgi:hypothetical protein
MRFQHSARTLRTDRDPRCTFSLSSGWAAAIALFSLQTLAAQELAPRAYIITPLHANAITLTYGFYDGSFNIGVIPNSGATGTYSIPTFSY